ncbi:hypothetical protein VNO78_14692 [Psophocarpus tetragonolobus]|uniref:non-specific serine/threonine protein kinase n=1 Tax=Psophocarpus tetragonolobus TaxID=3891 RepID=A0AAN9SDB3_PSOTE
MLLFSGPAAARMKGVVVEPCLVFLLILVVISSNSGTCVGEDDVQCSNAFRCGSSNLNLKYPFWGGNRDEYCGVVLIICEDQVPKISIHSIKYRILGWDNTTRILTVARDDYWEANTSVCVTDYNNNSFDQTPFQYDYEGLVNVTLFYNCSSDSLPNPIITGSAIHCGADPVYYALGSLSPLPGSSSSCKVVVVPVFESNYNHSLTSSNTSTNTNTINEALKSGFKLIWTGATYEECRTCTHSGGECGFQDDTQFRCFCKDGPHATSCVSVTHTVSIVMFSVSVIYQAVFLKMQLLPTILFSFLVITILLNQISTSSCADDVHYLKCSSTFHCANLQNLSYPFWGFSRPQYCGHPAFMLQCTGEVATVTIMSESYRVLEVNDSDHKLKLVRTDYWNNTCPTSLRNITIGCTFFDYGSDSLNLTLYYDCPSPSFLQPDSFSPQFNCSVNGTQMINYFVVKNMLENAQNSISLSERLGTCKSRVLLPILESEAQVLETNSTVENLKAALDNGFGVDWDANNSLCDECQSSGGYCGYNPSSTEFACHCRDGSFPSTCKSGE